MTDREDKGLMPCPWCGCASATLYRGPMINYVTCDGEGCGADGPARDNAPEAAAAWNTRSPLKSGTAGGEVTPADREVLASFLAILKGDRGDVHPSMHLPGKMSSPDPRVYVHGPWKEPIVRLIEAALSRRAGEGDGWKLTENKPPADCIDVDAVWWGGDRKMAFIRDGKWWYYGQYGIKCATVAPKHWRKLPPPPEREGELPVGVGA